MDGGQGLGWLVGRDVQGEGYVGWVGEAVAGEGGEVVVGGAAGVLVGA